ncbi:hypothetical protein BSKO_03818 [Bryopsis sp. KO-2023]|nr:hypothetical protein BSKO_03818 [Bryopsis sp. KO-2023]
MENGETTPPQPAMAEEAEEKVLVTVEVCLKANSSCSPTDIKESVHRFLKHAGYLTYQDHTVPIPVAGCQFLTDHVESIKICDTGTEGGTLLWWQIDARVHVYKLDVDGAEDEDDCTDAIPSYREWAMPSQEFYGLWDALYYDTSIKQRLLHYAHTALLFADHRVDPQLISWNRVILLHGPPGTGKTSLCKALAQKLAIRFMERYPQGGQLIELNAHSLFSKYFSESGKLVSSLFTKIQEIVEEEDSLVFVLIDEVESLAAARRTNSSEPSDAIRAVNALLTQLDNLKRYPNVLVLATSNLTGSIDLAFVDRADIKAFIGPPTIRARYEILRSCIAELQRAGIISGGADESILSMVEYMRRATGVHASCSSPALAVSSALHGAAEACKGFSGRALRKLPFLAHASNPALSNPCSCATFINALKSAILRESQDRSHLDT